MTKTKYLSFMLVAAMGLAACGDREGGQNAIDHAKSTAGNAPAATTGGSENFDGTVTQTGPPFLISYRLIGTPVVGSPVTVGLRVQSAEDPRPIRLDYRINDGSSMVFPDGQLASVQLEPAANENHVVQQVTVVPQREGRLYLNVSAAYQDGDGTLSTVAAIPIQVGSSGRQPEPDSELRFDGGDAADAN